MEEVYSPAEDSFLLARHVEKLVSGKVLDMGTGSGIQAVTAAFIPSVLEVLAVDINPAALEVAKERAESAEVLGKITFLHSDLFRNVRERFDWIIFNAPYLPSEGEADETSWTGGAELINKFLRKSRKHLTRTGTILLIYSSLSVPCFDGFKVELLEEIGLFFERLYCVKLNPI